MYPLLFDMVNRDEVVKGLFVKVSDKGMKYDKRNSMWGKDTEGLE
jgi:hypothetical protein